MPVLDVFAPDLKDLDWMCRQYQQVASHGHFYSNLGEEDADVVIRRNLRSIIERECMIDFSLRAKAYLFFLKNKKVGYAVMTDIRTMPDAFELHLFVVDRKRRGQGFGKQMLDYLLMHWNRMNDVYARCYPVSRAMIGLLQKSGFEFVHENSEGAAVYYRPASEACSVFNRNIRL